MSRILFPEASTSSSNGSTSYKAPYRPGKIPLASGSRPIIMKRSDSIISLPSPPSERRLQSSLLPSQSQSLLNTNTISSEEGRMQIDDDDDRLGRGANHITNPFLLLASRGNDRDPIASVPDHPQSSPTQLARRNRNKRIDRDRILFGPPIVQEDKVEKKEDIRLKDGMGPGWDDPSNPFIAKEGEGRNWKKGQAQRPEKMTYVFRGKRITYDIPLSTFLSPDDPSESPFPLPSPRLLFPAEPITPPSSTNPSSSFLEALRGSRDMKSPVKRMKDVDHGLPTPVREGRRLGRGGGAGGEFFSPYKRY